eukprot:m.341346 g.341346  ORF g.341346 m.341346 type:complete len:420 (-) comp20608_c0_seq1:789-2048(-)
MTFILQFPRRMWHIPCAVLKVRPFVAHGPYRTLRKIPRPRTRNVTEIGRLQTPRTSPYESGQFLLHGQLGYSGVIVHQSMTTVIEYLPNSTGNDDAPDNKSTLSVDHENAESSATAIAESTIVTRNVPLYMVMVNEADITQGQWATKAFTPNVQSMISRTSLRASFDFIEHKDVLPYEPTKPLVMSLSRDSQGAHRGTHRRGKTGPGIPTVGASDGTCLFQNKNLCDFFEDSPALPAGRVQAMMTVKQTPSIQILLNAAELELSYTVVYKCNTNGIEVTVVPFVGASSRCVNGNLVHRWAFSVTVENKSDRTVRLMKQTLRKTDGSREVRPSRITRYRSQEYDLSKTPILTPEKNIYKFSVNAALKSEHGSLWGNFEFDDMTTSNNGPTFNVTIPKVFLRRPPSPTKQTATPNRHISSK